jgi:hypothetical protein
VVSDKHVYGRSITFRYTPIAENEAFVANSLVSARIYGPNTYPSAEQIADAGQASIGHIGARVTSWALVNDEGTGPAEYKIVFPPLVDATPGNVEFDIFHVALNYLAEAGGPTLQDVEQLTVYRPDGLTSKIRVKAQDVYDLDSKVEKEAESLLWTEGKINAAKKEMEQRLAGRGYELRKTFNLERLNTAAAMLSCSYCCMNLYSSGDESWKVKADLWRGLADKQFDMAQIGYDTSGTDTPDPRATVTTGAVAFLR